MPLFRLYVNNDESDSCTQEEVMPSITLSFTGDTQAEVKAAIRRWIADLERVGPEPAADREQQVRDAMRRIRGEGSLRLIRDVAEASLRGDGLRRDADLLARYQVASGTALAGMAGGANKAMRRQAGRDLI